MLPYFTQMVTEKSPKKVKNSFICECCDYKCSKNSEYIKHLLTRKHIENAAGNTKISENQYTCEICNKVYKSRKGLWSHNKVCIVADAEVKTLSNLVIELIKNNNELQSKMLEMCHIQNNTINSHNKTFNLQFFLNEQCKDAMNLMDFVDSFKLQFADLEQVGEIGYIEGISNIIMKKLNEMDVHKRPIHCSDAKRVTLYVKDDNVWEKETPTCDKLRKAIKYISKKNSDLIPAWQTKNPLANNFASHVNDQYLQIIKESMGGSGEVIESENKIIKKLAKAVLIEKL